MQLLCPFYVCVACVVLSLKVELSESILKQLVKHLFCTFLLLFRFKSKYGYPVSSKITKLYFILNIIQLPSGLVWHTRVCVCVCVCVRVCICVYVVCVCVFIHEFLCSPMMCEKVQI